MSSATALVAASAANHADGVDETSSMATAATASMSAAAPAPASLGQTKAVKLSAANADKLGVVLQGYLKKQKTMKKKYFVLVNDNGEKPARLEYYDSEKKCRSRFGHPKRSIVLKSCFHISRRLDTKQKFVIALYTKEDSFCIVLETETEMSRWLEALQILHRINESVEMPRTTFGKCPARVPRLRAKVNTHDACVFWLLCASHRVCVLE